MSAGFKEERQSANPYTVPYAANIVAANSYALPVAGGNVEFHNQQDIQ